jgi:hypothetical protein
MKKDQHNILSRRRFLTGVAGAAPTVAAVAVAPRAAVAAPTTDEPTQDGKGYRLTPHVMAYYKTAAE